MKDRSKQLVVAVALAGAVTVGTAGVAVAAGGGSGSVPAPGTAEATPVATAERHPRRVIHRIAHVVRDTLGVERGALREGMRNGQSIAEFATSLGQDPQVVADALLGAVNTRVDRAVADGRMTAERGEEITANAPARIDALMHRHVGAGRSS